MKEGLIKALNLLVKTAVWMLLMACIHEFCHHLVAQALGYSGYITLDGFWSGVYYTDGILQGSTDWYIIGFAGGIGTAVILGLLYMVARFTPTYWDLADEFILGTIAAGQFGYGLAEGAAWQTPLFEPLALGLMATFSLPMAILGIWRWADWAFGRKGAQWNQTE